ncbi:Uncharacterised protein [Bordetella pertussis]|nr:Uncharacterised protein [Bordetella pertussis]
MPEYTSPYTEPVAPLGVTRRISMSRDGAATPSSVRGVADTRKPPAAMPSADATI